MTKDELRQQMRERRKAVSQDDRRAAGKAICKKMVNDCRLWPRSWHISLYLSTWHEIPTRYIARAAWETEREVCVPAWSKSANAYKLYALTPQTKLLTGHHGIREPAVRQPVMPWDVDAFILPGLVFDLCGGRLGYGGGHYDRILAKANPIAIKIAIGYDWQVVEAPLPQEAHDIAMDWIVTDTRLIDCRGNRQARG